jgi:hypothetical protein
MTSSSLSLFRRRLLRQESGFSLIEVVVALGIMLVSLTTLATTALVGFTGASTARHRQTATGIADGVVEQVRGLPWSTVTQGMKSSDLSSDSNIASCSGTYKYLSCSGETIVQSSGASTAPLYPHTVTDSSGYTRSLYLTQVSGSTGLYRLTVTVSWTYKGLSSSVQTQTLLSHPAGTAETSTQTSSGGSVASFFGDGSITPGNVVVSPNGSVYNGVGVTGLSSSVWNTGDSVKQTLYSLDANLAQSQTTQVNGQSTLTAVKKSISGTVTGNGGSTTLSQADDDPATGSVTTSSAPSSITQTGPSLSLSGGGNSVGMNQYTATAGSITLVGTSSSSTGGSNGASSLTINLPSGGVTTGDVLLAEIGIHQSGTISAPSGWTQVRSDTNVVTSTVFTKVAGSSEPSSYTFTTPASSHIVGGIIAYRGVDTTNPVNVTGVGTGTSATATAPSVTTTVANTRVVSIWVASQKALSSLDAATTTQWNITAGVGNGQGANIRVGDGVGGETVAAIGATTARNATINASTDWLAQTIALRPSLTTGPAGTETGATVSTTAAASTPACGTPAQTDGKPCAYATQSYSSTNQGYFDTTVDLSGYGLGKCVLYSLNPPSSNPTSYAYGRRAATSGDGKLTEDVKRYYGTNTFGQLCGSTGSTPNGWPGYFVKFDASNSAAQATAGAGCSAAAPSTSTAGTISVWNGSGTTSFSVPTTGTWSTTPTDLDFTTSSNYRYQISSTLGSGTTYTTSASMSSPCSGYSEAKAVVGAPVTGTITYKLTDVTTTRVLIDVTVSIDLGSLISYGKYTAAA